MVSGRILVVIEDRVLEPSRYFSSHFENLELGKNLYSIHSEFLLLQDYAKTDGLEYICPQCSVSTFKKKMQKTSNGYS